MSRGQLIAAALAAIVCSGIAWAVWASLPPPAPQITVVLAAARPTSATLVPSSAREPTPPLPANRPAFAAGPLGTPLVAPATPTMTASTDPVQSPAPAPTGVAHEDAWAMLQPELDAAWSTDTPGAIGLLTAFLAESPDHPAAREKLYAALLSEADRLVDGDQAEQAIARLERATELLPARGEALAALVALTPRPAPVAIRPPPPPARVAPAPAPPPAPPEAPPTPTKVPFRP